jgi:hypothetical protein
MIPILVAVGVAWIGLLAVVLGMFHVATNSPAPDPDGARPITLIHDASTAATEATPTRRRPRRGALRLVQMRPADPSSRGPRRTLIQAATPTIPRCIDRDTSVAVLPSTIVSATGNGDPTVGHRPSSGP